MSFLLSYCTTTARTILTLNQYFKIFENVTDIYNHLGDNFTILAVNLFCNIVFPAQSNKSRTYKMY